jgi:hypothetical protein
MALSTCRPWYTGAAGVAAALALVGCGGNKRSDAEDSFDKIVISANTYRLSQDVSHGVGNSKVIRDTQKLIDSAPDARDETKRHAFNRAISIVADYCGRCVEMLQDARP